MSKYEELIARTTEVALLGSTGSLLHWDQETYMPPGGVEHRAKQLAQIAGLAHKWATDPALGDLLAECEADADLTADPHSDTAANLREIRKSYDRATKLPNDLVTERTKTRAIATHHWQEARQKADFDLFRPWLEKNVDLARRTADCYGWEDGEEPWDALAETYESGMRAKGVEDVFTPLRDRLQGLISDLVGGPRKPSDELVHLSLPIDKQQALVHDVVETMGFDFSRGRIDLSTHPFCGGTCVDDVRLTNRYRDDGFVDSLGGGMHEAGHGLYEQGIPREHDLTPLGSAVSLGIHESQSRLWENFVGRSEAFWRWAAPRVKETFGAAVAHLSEREMYEAFNQVEPSFIRVEADEATYNLHIMVRFELERVLMNGELDAKDLPLEWNGRYKEYLGVDVPNDALGCLQDIHWSGGSFGYFPTYTLGNLYAAQIFEKVLEDIPDLYDSFANGDLIPLKVWLNENIHVHGARYEAAELCERATGKPLSADPLLRHLEGKLRPLYGV
jgi:carboxypeptidase Taq